MSPCVTAKQIAICSIVHARSRARVLVTSAQESPGVANIHALSAAVMNVDLARQRYRPFALVENQPKLNAANSKPREPVTEVVKRGTNPNYPVATLRRYPVMRLVWITLRSNVNRFVDKNIQIAVTSVNTSARSVLFETKQSHNGPIYPAIMTVRSHYRADICATIPAPLSALPARDHVSTAASIMQSVKLKARAILVVKPTNASIVMNTVRTHALIHSVVKNVTKFVIVSHVTDDAS